MNSFRKTEFNLLLYATLLTSCVVPCIVCPTWMVGDLGAFDRPERLRPCLVCLVDIRSKWGSGKIVASPANEVGQSRLPTNGLSTNQRGYQPRLECSTNKLNRLTDIVCLWNNTELRQRCQSFRQNAHMSRITRRRYAH